MNASAGGDGGCGGGPSGRHASVSLRGTIRTCRASHAGETSRRKRRSLPVAARDVAVVRLVEGRGGCDETSPAMTRDPNVNAVRFIVRVLSIVARVERRPVSRLCGVHSKDVLLRRCTIFLAHHVACSARHTSKHDRREDLHDRSPRFSLNARNPALHRRLGRQDRKTRRHS